MLALIFSLATVPFFVDYYLFGGRVFYGVFDSITLSFLNVIVYLACLYISRRLFFVVSSLVFLSEAGFIFINYEYYKYFSSYLSYESIPLLNDLWMASGLLLSPYVFGGTSFVLVIFLLCLYRYSLAGRKVGWLPTLSIMIVLLGGVAWLMNAHSNRYEQIQELNSGEEFVYRLEYENPVMFFVRSFFGGGPGVKDEMLTNSYEKSIQSAITNGLKVPLPESVDARRIAEMVPKYPGYEYVGDEYSALKFSPQKPHEAINKLNVLLVVMESFRERELTPELAPNFNKIKEKGLYFSNFYATNRVTVKSELSMLCGLLDHQEKPPFALLQQNIKTKCLPSILAKYGYQTSWFHGYTDKFFNRNVFHKSLGFQEIFSKEDFLELGYDTEFDIGWGVPDNYLFDYVLGELETREKPFFAEVLTLTNHQPFNWKYHGVDFPDFLKSPKETPYGNYKRGIYYSDWALGEFWKRFSKSRLRDNTLLIITADHGVPFYDDAMVGEYDKFETLFKMPLVIISPDREVGVANIASSHLDLAPTVLSYLNINEGSSFLGRPLIGEMQEFSERPIFMLNSSNYGFVRGALKCLPVSDFCSSANANCVNIGNLQCHSDKGVDLESVQAMKSLKRYIEFFAGAKYSGF